MIKKILYFIIPMILLYLFACNNKGRVIDNSDVIDEKEISNTYEVKSEDDLRSALKDSYSITLEENISTNNDLVLEGDFSITYTTEKNIVNEVGRKLHLSNGKGKSFTLTAPKLVIKSKNVTMSGGTFIGDLNIEANGFILNGTKVEGNIFFKSKEIKESYKMKNDAKVVGKVEIK